jgi:hypothetical protein
MFLQILGVIFLAVIGVVAYYAWKIYRFTRAHANSDIAIAMSVLPSQEMDLEPSNSEEWIEKELLAHSESELKRIGAKHVGYFCVYSGYATIRISLWDIQHHIVAALYEAQAADNKKDISYIYEVACKLDNGSICITSNPHAVYDSRPNNHIIAFDESRSIIDFLRAMKSEIPGGKKLLRITDAKDFFLECYEDISEWSWQKNQLNSEKTQQVLSSVGVNATEELMQELIDLGISYSVEVNINRTRRKLAKHSKMSVEKWERIRDKLVIINENMQTSHIVDAIYDLAGELSESQQRVLQGFQENSDTLIDPISAFQMLASSMNLKVKRLTKMETPVKTEVYLPL